MKRKVLILSVLLFSWLTMFAFQEEFGKPVEYVKSPNNKYRGSLSQYQRIKSNVLGYDLRYKVYVPANYQDLNSLPAIYLTDGPEYINPEGGDMVVKIDELIDLGKIKPIIAIFIDPRNPDNSWKNRRNTEFFTNDNYVQFITHELVPQIDKNFKTSTEPSDRAIMGLSFGGLNAAYFGVKAHHTFRIIGMQSPALHPRPEIYKLYQDNNVLPIKIFLTTGTKGDTETGARRLKAVLDEKGYDYYYKEVPEGHNWKNWKPLIEEALLYFFGI